MEKTITLDHLDFLSNFFEFLPDNCIFNKGMTGCGGSYLELHSKRNSIVLVPTIELVKNKTEDGIQPVYGAIKDAAIKQYLQTHSIKKLLGTYDSITRLIKLVNPKDYFLLIDEYHVLFNSYVFRDEAIRSVLENFKRFKAFCFMSATPLTELCILKELEDIDRITIQWKDTTPVKIEVLDTHFTTSELFNVFNRDPFCNWHIFLNSVATIRQVVPKLDDDYKVVCSTANQKKSLVKLNYGTTLDAAKKYNFYTSCSFEGCDIFDKKGRTVIVCDTSIATTILDISTLIRQICGRLRDSVYKDQVILILNTHKHRYAGLDDFSFKSRVVTNIRDGKRCEEQFNSFSQADKNLEIRKYSPETYNSFYVNMYNLRIFYDDNLRKMDEYNYKLVSEIYDNSISVMKVCEDNNLETVYGETKGVNWVKEKLLAKEYTYAELEATFKPIFAANGVEWSKQTSIDQYFPSYTKKRKTIKGVKETIYKFSF